jgi:hypothetical protein
VRWVFTRCGKEGKRLGAVRGGGSTTPGVLQESAQTIDPGIVTETLFFGECGTYWKDGAYVFVFLEKE